MRLRVIAALAVAALAVPAAAWAVLSPAQRAVQVATASLKGQHAVRWAALHPKYQAVVSKEPASSRASARTPPRSAR